MRPNTAKRQ